MEESLEHFGVKGMRWGKRKQSDNSANAPPSDTNPLYREVGSGGMAVSRSGGIARKAAKGGAVVAGVATLAIGAAVVASLTAKHADVPVRSLPSFKTSGSKYAGQAKNMWDRFQATGAKSKWETVSEGGLLKEGQKYASATIKTYGSTRVSDLPGTALEVIRRR